MRLCILTKLPVTLRKLECMELKIRAEKIGNVWVGCIEGYPEIAERALSKEAAEEKARRIARMIERGEYNPLRRRRSGRVT